MPASMQRTEPPASSMVGTRSGSSVALRSITAFCAALMAVEQVHAHPGGFQPGGGLGDLGMGLAGGVAGRRGMRAGLESVVGGGLWVGVEVVRAHHDGGGGGMKGRRGMVVGCVAQGNPRAGGAMNFAQGNGEQKAFTMA